MTDRPRLTVCICTYRRPEQLTELLRRVAASGRDAADLVEVGAVVVDDDRDGSAAPVAEAAAGDFPLGLEYRCSGSGNVAIARNTALEVAVPISDLLAMIDDDCLPDDGWLRHLVTVQQRYGADCVTGACDTELPPGAPRWLATEPFLDEASSETDGALVEGGYLKNTLISAAFLRDHDLRFDLRFGEAGGEDAMFFHEAHVAGLHHRHAAGAVVREQLPVERSSLPYQLRRRYWYGNTEALTAIAAGRTTRARVAVGGVRLVVTGLVRPIRRVLARHDPQWRFALSEVLRGGGRVLAAAGIEAEHR